MAYIMDTYEEEREKGKTVDIGKTSLNETDRQKLKELKLI